MVLLQSIIHSIEIGTLNENKIKIIEIEYSPKIKSLAQSFQSVHKKLKVT